MSLTPADGTLIGPTRQDLALQLGAMRHDRDLLVRQVLAVHAGLEDGSAPEQWRILLRLAQWISEHEEVTG